MTAREQTKWRSVGLNHSPRLYRDDELISALRRVIDQVSPSRNLTISEYDAFKAIHPEVRMPTSDTIRRQLGGWVAALSAATAKLQVAGLGEPNTISAIHAAKILRLLLVQPTTLLQLIETTGLRRNQIELLLQSIREAGWVIYRQHSHGPIKVELPPEDGGPRFVGPQRPGPVRTSSMHSVTASVGSSSSQDKTVLTVELYYQGFSNAEIARRLGINQVEAKLQRLRARGIISSERPRQSPVQ